MLDTEGIRIAVLSNHPFIVVDSVTPVTSKNLPVHVIAIIGACSPKLEVCVGVVGLQYENVSKYVGILHQPAGITWDVGRAEIEIKRVYKRNLYGLVDITGSPTSFGKGWNEDEGAFSWRVVRSLGPTTTESGPFLVPSNRTLGL